MQVERISVVTPQVTEDIKAKINASGNQVVFAVSQSLMGEIQGNLAQFQVKDGGKGFYEALVLKFNTPEKLEELRAMDQFSKDLLSRIANIAAGLLFSGMTGQFLGTMGAVTSEESLTNFIMVQALAPARTLVASLRENYTDEVIAEVVALPQS